VVGGSLDPETAKDGGAAFLFVRKSGAWIEDRKAVAADAAEGDRLGGAVAIHGRTVLLGATGDDDGGTDSGSVYVLEEVGAPIPALVLTAGGIGDSTVGLGVRMPLAAAGGLPPLTFSAEGDFPVSGGVDAATGLVDGLWERAGTHDFTLRVTDACGTVAERSYSVRVSEAPAFGTRWLPVCAEDRPWEQDLDPTGGTGGLSIELAAGTLPAGIALDPATGVLTGRPDSPGEYGVRFRATDALGATALSEEMRIEVLAVADLDRSKSKEELDLGQGQVVRVLELLEGSLLSVKVKVRKGGPRVTLGLEFEEGWAMKLGASLKSKRRGVKLKKLEIPQTGRYLLYVSSVDEAAGPPVRLVVKVKPPKRLRGESRIGAGETGSFTFAALPGASAKIRVKAPKGSDAAPEIVSVTDASGTELLDPAEVKVRGRSVKLKLDGPLPGGTIRVTVRAREGVAADLLHKVRLKQPKGYGWSEPERPSELISR